MVVGMEKIALGKQGLTVSKQGFGCMGLTTAYGTKMPDNEIIALLQKVHDSGVTFWDTANIYCYPDFWKLLWLQSPVVCQEEIIGRAVKQIGRENVVLATKTGIELSVFPKLKLTPCGQPSFVRAQCEASLKRLGVDCLDLFYIHRPDQTLPIEITMMELKKLVQEKKIKYVGLSECSAKTMKRAHAIHPLTAVQLEYSLWARGIEEEILPLCKELGIGLVAYSPLGRGFLGGAHKQELKKGDFRLDQERFKEEKNDQMYQELVKIANAKGVTSSQLALAWVEAQQWRLGGAGIVAIPGTTKETHLLSNVESLKITLTEQDIKDIEAAVPWKEIVGSRYGPGSTTWELDQNPELTPLQAAELGLETK